jgi:Bacterial antitoxin of type II TA system, VapB
MRTTLDIADGLIDALMARYPDASKTEAIEIAIAAHLSEDAAAWLRAQAGTVAFDEDTWREGRAVDRERAERVGDLAR